MAVATAIQGAAGIAGGAAKFFEGRKMQRAAQVKIDNFEWDELTNSYKNNQVSTLGADLQREEAGRNTATSVDAIRSAGTRGIVGALGRVQANNNLMNKKIGADLDMQQKKIDMMASQDDSVIRGMQESRQSNELAGYGQQMNVGMGMKYGGITNAINGMGALGEGVEGIKSEQEN